MALLAEPTRRALSWLSQRSAPAKLGVWLASLVALWAIAEVAAIATGWPLSLTRDKFGNIVMLLTSLTGLLGIVASERRPVAAYGLIADRRCIQRGLWGLAGGAAVYGGYIAALIASGAADASLTQVSLGKCLKALLAVPGSIPMAAVQQVIFSGMLLGLLRPQLGRTVAVAVPALLFGLTVGLGSDLGLVSPDGMRLAIGMTLLAVLLGLLRLASGSIVMPAGALAGAIAVRRGVSKLRLVDFDTTNAWIDWLAPAGDPRQAIAFWALLLIPIAGAIAHLARRGERVIATDPLRDTQFKRFMPFSNLLTFTPLERWLVVLTQARWRVGLTYVPRLVITLLGSAINTVLALPERLLLPLLLKHDVPSPVFVVGVHRSGTTHLHNMLSLDPQFRAPRNYEVFNPFGFLTGWFTTALMTPALMWRRPMDSVQMTPFSSQEEEFALAAMGSPSPYMAFCLPGESRRHLAFMHAESFSGRQLARWKRDYQLFLRKLTWFSRRTPLLKNPANTGRIAMLAQMFPRAKFVVLVRHPEAVYRSNVHFARVGLAVFQLQDQPEVDGYTDLFLENYRRASTAAERALAKLPSGQGLRVKFEQLESDPEATISHIYSELGLTMSLAYRQQLRQYVAKNADYQKNQLRPLDARDAAAVHSAMGEFYGLWGYDLPAEERRAA